MIVHAVNISAPALAWDRDAIKVSVNAVDDVMDCETEEEVIWPGSEESQEHEDEDEEDVKKEEEDKDMQEGIKKRRSGSRSSRMISSFIPRPPSPPRSRCGYFRNTPIPPPPFARSVVLNARPK